MTPFERLCRLVPITERLIADEKPFDMMTFAEDVDDLYNCGTAACLAGWAARDPVFRAEGLSLQACYAGARVAYDGSTDSWPALACFFGLSSLQADYIFGGHNRNSLEDALIRVRIIIDKQRKVAE